MYVWYVSMVSYVCMYVCMYGMYVCMYVWYGMVCMNVCIWSQCSGWQRVAYACIDCVQGLSIWCSNQHTERLPRTLSNAQSHWNATIRRCAHHGGWCLCLRDELFGWVSVGVIILPMFPKQSVCAHSKDWRCRARVTPVRSPWRALVACVPHLRQRQSFSRTLLPQKPKSV